MLFEIVFHQWAHCYLKQRVQFSKRGSFTAQLVPNSDSCQYVGNKFWHSYLIQSVNYRTIFPYKIL